MQKRWIVLGCALALTLGFRTQTKQRVIEAEKFVLKSANQKVSIEMRMDGDMPVIALYDDQGNERFQVHGGKAPGICVLNEKKQIVANFSSDAEGAPQITLRDEKNKEALTMQGGKQPRFAMTHQENTQVEMTASKDGSIVKFNDEIGKTKLQVQGGAFPGVYLRNDKGDVIGSFVTLSKGGAALGLANSKGDVAAFMRGGASPSISFYREGSYPDLIMGISEKSPHILMSRSDVKDGVLIYGGAPSSMLFFNEQGQVPVVLSKKGLMHARRPPASAKSKKKQFYSWKPPESEQQEPESNTLPKD